jgi:antitoxin MazE
MRSTVRKWGNSLALRVPVNVAHDLDLVEGSEVVIKAEGGQLVATPARPRYRLEDLLVGYPEVDKHPKIDWGEPRGKEVW